MRHVMLFHFSISLYRLAVKGLEIFWRGRRYEERIELLVSYKKMNRQDISKALEIHLRNFFQGHSFEVRKWPLGPIKHELPGFKVLEVSPGPRVDIWSYISMGAWQVCHENVPVQEFVISTREKHDCQVEYLAMIAHYHLHEKLGVGHTVPIGKPWLPDSKLNCFLVSIPYPFGPELEIFDHGTAHLHINWLLPISEAEKKFRHEHGLEELEKRFDDAALEFWDEHRESVV